MRYSIGVLVAVILWSLSFVWTKGVLEYLSPLMLISMRVLIAALLLGGFSLVSGRMQKVSRRDKKIFMALSLVEPVGYFLFETSGIRFVTPTLACVIISAIPMLTPFFAAAINGERPLRREWAGLGISMTGVLTVLMSDGWESFGGRLTGVLLLFGAVATSIIYTLVIQRLTRRYNSFTIVSWENIFAVVYLIPLLLLFDRGGVTGLAFSWDWAWGVLALGVLCSCAAFVLYADGIRALGVTRTSMFVNLMPGMTAIASFFILGEQLSVVKIAGITITVMGLMIGMGLIKSGVKLQRIITGVKIR